MAPVVALCCFLGLKMGVELRFVADVMLGRLSRWLRLIGFDTLYKPDQPDAGIIREAVRDGRIILTRDRHFLERKNLPGLFFLKSDSPAEQLLEVVRRYGMPPEGAGRCGQCNGLLAEAQKASVLDEVPEYVYAATERFYRCTACGRVYWEGSHMRRFRSMIDGFGIRSQEAQGKGADQACRIRQGEGGSNAGQKNQGVAGK